MNRIIAIFIMSILSYNCFNAFPINGSLIGQQIEINDIVRYTIQFVSERTPYTTGGVTVTYPITFSNPPAITVSVEAVNGPMFDPETTYSALVVDNSVGSCTIAVTKAVETGGVVTISEAGTGEVFISLLAIDSF